MLRHTWIAPCLFFVFSSAAEKKAFFKEIFFVYFSFFLSKVFFLFSPPPSKAKKNFAMGSFFFVKSFSFFFAYFFLFVFVFLGLNSKVVERESAQSKAQTTKPLGKWKDFRFVAVWNDSGMNWRREAGENCFYYRYSISVSTSIFLPAFFFRTRNQSFSTTISSQINNEATVKHSPPHLQRQHNKWITKHFVCRINDHVASYSAQICGCSSCLSSSFCCEKRMLFVLKGNAEPYQPATTAVTNVVSKALCAV